MQLRHGPQTTDHKPLTTGLQTTNSSRPLSTVHCPLSTVDQSASRGCPTQSTVVDHCPLSSGHCSQQTSRGSALLTKHATCNGMQSVDDVSFRTASRRVQCLASIVLVALTRDLLIRCIFIFVTTQRQAVSQNALWLTD